MFFTLRSLLLAFLVIAAALGTFGPGTSATIAVVEAHGLGIHWMEPRDLDFDTLAADGSVYTLPWGIPGRELARLLKRNDGLRLTLRAELIALGDLTIEATDSLASPKHQKEEDDETDR